MDDEIVIKIVRPDKNIASQDPRDFILRTDTNMLKILKEDYAESSVVTGNIFTRNIAHGLGYKPMVFGYFEHPENHTWHMTPSIVDIPNTNGYLGSEKAITWGLAGNLIHVDDDNVQMRLYDSIDAMPTSPTVVKNKAYIMADPRSNAWYLPGQDNDAEQVDDRLVLKIARPGVDVRTASPENLILDDEMNIPQNYRIVHDSTKAGPNPIIVPHGLDYPPMFFPYYRGLDDQYWTFGNFGYAFGGTSRIFVDETYVYVLLSYSGTPPNPVKDVSIILMTEPLNE